MDFPIGDTFFDVDGNEVDQSSIMTTKSRCASGIATFGEVLEYVMETFDRQVCFNVVKENPGLSWSDIMKKKKEKNPRRLDDRDLQDLITTHCVFSSNGKFYAVSEETLEIVQKGIQLPKNIKHENLLTEKLEDRKQPPFYYVLSKEKEIQRAIERNSGVKNTVNVCNQIVEILKKFGPSTRKELVSHGVDRYVLEPMLKNLKNWGIIESRKEFGSVVIDFTSNVC